CPLAPLPARPPRPTRRRLVPGGPDDTPPALTVCWRTRIICIRINAAGAARTWKAAPCVSEATDAQRSGRGVGRAGGADSCRRHGFLPGAARERRRLAGG